MASTLRSSGARARRSGLVRLRQAVSGIEARLDRIEHELEEHPRTYALAISDLGDRRYALLSSVTVVLEEYKGEVVARWPDVGVYASGTTESEAIAGIKRQVVELFEELRDMKPGALGRLPLSWKRILGRTVRRNAQAPQGERGPPGD